MSSCSMKPPSLLPVHFPVRICTRCFSFFFMCECWIYFIPFHILTVLLITIFLFILCSWWEVNFSVYDRFHHLLSNVSLGSEYITAAHPSGLNKKNSSSNLDPGPVCIYFSKRHFTHEIFPNGDISFLPILQLNKTVKKK